MNTFSCIIRTRYPAEDIHKLFAPEAKREHKRSTVTIKENGGNAEFHIDAQDITALRASINGVTTLLGTYEKTLRAVHGKDTE